MRNQGGYRFPIARVIRALEQTMQRRAHLAFGLSRIVQQTVALAAGRRGQTLPVADQTRRRLALTFDRR